MSENELENLQSYLDEFENAVDNLNWSPNGEALKDVKYIAETMEQAEEAVRQSGDDSLADQYHEIRAELYSQPTRGVVGDILEESDTEAEGVEDLGLLTDCPRTNLAYAKQDGDSYTL